MNKVIRQLKSDIAEANLVINDPDIADNVKEDMRTTVSQMQEQLEAEKEKEEKKQEKEDKKKNGSEEDEKKGNDKLMFAGVSVRKADADAMHKAFQDRMEQVRATGGRVKTKSILD